MEFCLGVLVARLAVSGRTLPAALLMGVLVGAILGACVVPLAVQGIGLDYPLRGAGTAARVPLVWPGLHGAPSSAPLAFVGQFSYSVNLVHWPILGEVESAFRFGMHLSVPVIMPAGCCPSLILGWRLHILAERPFMARRRGTARTPLRTRLLQALSTT